MNDIHTRSLGKARIFWAPFVPYPKQRHFDRKDEPDPEEGGWGLVRRLLRLTFGTCTASRPTAHY